LSCPRALRDCIGTRLAQTAEDGIEALSNVIIGKAKHAQAAQRERRVSFCILLALLLVDRAVYFDHQRSSVAVEVDDEAINDLLPAEMKVEKASSAHLLPEDPLSSGHLEA